MRSISVMKTSPAVFVPAVAWATVRALALARLVAFVSTFSVLATSTNGATYTNVFFDSSQTATVLNSNINSATIQSGDYRFTYSIDGYWSPAPGGEPTGRFFSVFWPAGIQAQGITTGPLVGSGANLTIKRADGKPFDLATFTGKLLANTAGAGGAFEIMPQLNGNDAFNDPQMFDATGYGGQSFSYAPMFHHYDTYKIHLWLDWALTAVTMIDTNPPSPPAASFTIGATASPAEGGVVSGGGSYPSNSTCALVATPNSGWGFANWTVNGTSVSTSPNYTFTVRSNRTVVGHFVPAYTVAVTASPGYGAAALTGDGTYNSNSLVTVRATPATGFQFVHWTDAGDSNPLSTSTNFSFNALANRTLVATFAPLPETAIFDFDTGLPALFPSQAVVGALSQSNRGLTATFSPLQGGWSVQTSQTEIIGAAASFLGNFLSPSGFFSTLKVQFSRPVTEVAFDFMTGEIVTEYAAPGALRLTAEAGKVAVGSTNVPGRWTTRIYPDGHVVFNPAAAFDTITLGMASAPVSAQLFWIDNLIVQYPATAAPSNALITVAASPPAGGTVRGGGVVATGTVVTVSAIANVGYVFTGWTDGPDPASATADFNFIATTNRTLTAHFATNTPPIAVGSTFYQVSGQPLSISIYDLMALDSDPDGTPIVFVGAGPTTSNGLALVVDPAAMRIDVPANDRPDVFSYVIADGNGGTAIGLARIEIITKIESRGIRVELLADPPAALATFIGVPWYFYTVQRSTNAAFTGTLQSWQLQTWADGSLSVWDDFSDLPAVPPEAFYRLSYP